MAWKVIASYFNHNNGNGGGHGGNGGGDEQETGATEDDDDPTLSISEFSTSSSSASATATKRRWLTATATFWSTKVLRGGSLDSLDEEAMLSSPTSSSSSSSSGSSSLLRMRNNRRVSRSGSIRVSDSPLHRGSRCGSPAFRRKKMRAAKSELNLPSSTTTTSSLSNGSGGPTTPVHPPPRLKSPAAAAAKNSNLPVPTTSASPAMVTKKMTNGVPLRSKKTNGKEEPASSSPRSSLNGTPNNSPGNSMFRETLKKGGNVDLGKRAVKYGKVSKFGSNGTKSSGKAVSSPKLRLRSQNSSSSSNSSSRRNSRELLIAIQIPIPDSKRTTAVSPARPVPPPKPSTLNSPNATKTAGVGGGGNKSKIPTSPPGMKTSPSYTLATSASSISSHNSSNAKSNSNSANSRTSTATSTAAKTRQNNSTSFRAPSSTSKSPSANSSNSHGHQSSSPRLARRGNQTNSNSHHHRPGHIPSYLSKSTLSASTGKLNNNNGVQMRGGGSCNKATKSRPASRDFDISNKTGAAAAGGSKTAANTGFPRQLAPTAKFRSDGEISICDLSASKQSGQHLQQEGGEQDEHIYESIGNLASSSNTRRGGESSLSSASATAAKNSASSVDSRLQSRSEAAAGGKTSSERSSRSHLAAAAAATQSTATDKSKSASLGSGSKKEVAAASASATASPSDLRQNINAFSKVRSRSLTFFQRLGGALGRRNSFRTTATSRQRSLLPFPPVITYPHDQDWVFFRGFSGKRRDEVNSTASSTSAATQSANHGPLLGVTSSSLHPVPPPRRRTRPRRTLLPYDGERPAKELRRSLSLTDAHFIAQAVCEGDAALIQELYPNFPRSEPIYAVVDKLKKKRNRSERPTSHHPTRLQSGNDTAQTSDNGGRAVEGNFENYTPPQPHVPSRLTPIPGSNSENNNSDGGGNSAATVMSAAAVFSLSSSSSAAARAAAAAGVDPGSVFQQDRKTLSTSHATASQISAAAGETTQTAHSTWRQQQQRVGAIKQQQQPPPPRRRNVPHSVVGNGDTSTGGEGSGKNNLYEQFSSQDGVTFSSPVMYVKQQDLHLNHHHHVQSTNVLFGHQARMELPDLLHPSPEKQLNGSSSASTLPMQRTVTKVSLQHDGGSTPRTPSTTSLSNRETTLISPWNRNNVNNNNNVRPDSTSSSDSSNLNFDAQQQQRTTSTTTIATTTAPSWPSSQHPFAQRAQVHYHQRQRHNQQHRQQILSHQENDGVTITTSKSGGVTLSPTSLTSSHELNIGGAEPKVRSLFNRAESADRLMLREYDNLRMRHARNRAQQKKMSAPAFSTSFSSGQHTYYNHDRDRNGNDTNDVNSCSLDESFRKILAKADNSISQAESILSNLRVERDEISAAAVQATSSTAVEQEEEEEEAECSADSEELASLGSDIETNIRRLEKTQAKINAALKTFRTVQALNDTHSLSSAANQQHQVVRGRRAMRQHLQINQRGFGTNESHSYCSLPVTNLETLPSKMRTARFDQFQHEQTAEKSRTAPAKLEGGGATVMAEQSKAYAASVTGLDSSGSCPTNPAVTALNANATVGNTGTRPKKTSLFRRHSFSLIASSSSTNSSNKEKSPASSTGPAELTSSHRESGLWYDGDVESDAGGVQHSRNSGVYDDAYSFSDSEGGFLPLRNRLRGLLGSFGKGKRKVQRQGSLSKKKEQIAAATVETRNGTSSPILKATLGEFTRQIENLARTEANESDAQQRQQLQHQISLPIPTKSVMLRQKKEMLAKADSSDTYISAASSFTNANSFSNRNSVISGQSVSSESFEQNSVSDEDAQKNSGGNSSKQSGGSSNGAGEEELSPAQRKEKKVYYIARELMTSERVFVDILKLLNVDFREYVQAARRESKSGILSDADFSRIFSNLPELQTLNEDLLQDFEDRIENWDTKKKIADVIVRKGPFLKLYTTYIREFSAVNHHFDDCCTKHPKFAKLVKEFEKRERCRNLRLKHFMLRPVQRLPQYRLLLDDYLKHLHEDSEDFDDTTNALRIVSDAAEHANDTIKQGDKFRKMLKLQSRLGDLELIRPGRELVKEGELQKISRKGVGPRYFVLLSDCLLYCTYAGSWSGDSTSLRVTYKIPLASLQVRVSGTAEADYQNEFNITSPVRSCTLRAGSVSERNDWLDALNSAVEEHVSRKATFSAASTAGGLSNGNGSCDNNGGSIVVGLHQQSELKIASSAPIWIPDRRVTMCQNCAVEFSVLVRRHHCRACGKVVCATCSGNRAPLRYREYEAARVCDECYELIEADLVHVDSLRPRFKKRDSSKHGPSSTRYVPQRLKVSSNGDGSLQMCGYLKKRLRNAKWKRMWFVLKDRVLYVYRASEDTVAAETFPILGYDLDTLSEKNFELYEGEYAGLVFILSHPGGESLVFCAENDNVCEKWISALREAIKLDNEEPTSSNC